MKFSLQDLPTFGVSVLRITTLKPPQLKDHSKIIDFLYYYHYHIIPVVNKTTQRRICYCGTPLYYYHYRTISVIKKIN